MIRDIKLNSNTWCDIIFEGKNKEYGAYEMRQTASKRYSFAFLTMLSALALFIFIPALLEETGIGSTSVTGVTEVVTISKFETDTKPEDEIITTTLPPPPVEIRKSLTFTPPVIVDDETDLKDKEMLSQDELSKDKSFLISSVTVIEGSTKGIDPAEILGDLGGPATSGTGDTAPVLLPEVPAQFLGGNAELMKYLRDNIKYPHVAIENNIEGRSVIRFVVSTDGTISNVEVVKTSDPSLDKEAIRVVKSMPKWVPGKVNGKNVNSYFTLPVTFKLNK